MNLSGKMISSMEKESKIVQMKQNRLENTTKEMYKERDFYNNLGYPGSKGKRLTIVPKENMFG